MGCLIFNMIVVENLSSQIHKCFVLCKSKWQATKKRLKWLIIFLIGTLCYICTCFGEDYKAIIIKHTCLKKTGLDLQILISTLHSILNITLGEVTPSYIDAYTCAQDLGGCTSSYICIHVRSGPIYWGVYLPC